MERCIFAVLNFYNEVNNPHYEFRIGLWLGTESAELLAKHLGDDCGYPHIEKWECANHERLSSRDVVNDVFNLVLNGIVDAFGEIYNCIVVSVPDLSALVKAYGRTSLMTNDVGGTFCERCPQEYGKLISENEKDQIKVEIILQKKEEIENPIYTPHQKGVN